MTWHWLALAYAMIGIVTIIGTLSMSSASLGPWAAIVTMALLWAIAALYIARRVSQGGGRW